MSQPAPIRDSKKEANRRRRERRKAVQDPEYLAWVKQQPCLIGVDCRGVVEAHHEPPKSHAGEWSDASCLALCSRHHTQRHHVLGPHLFAEKYGISLAARALELRGRYLAEQV